MLTCHRQVHCNYAGSSCRGVPPSCLQVAAARDSSILLALSPTDFLLPALATGLQVPRALLRDHMWLTGALRPGVACQLLAVCCLQRRWWPAFQPRRLPCCWMLAAGWHETLPPLCIGCPIEPHALGPTYLPLLPWPHPHAGTSWATVFACLQAAIVAAAHGELANAAAALAAPLLCSAWLLRSVARAQGHNAPLQALGPAAAAYQREARTWRHVAAHLRRRWLTSQRPYACSR